MHHHHPPPLTTAPIPTVAAAVTNTSSNNNNSNTAVPTTTTTNTTGTSNAPSNSVGGHAQQRRRKKRPNYGTRTVEVRRGYNGFGFTISGQQPCRLSCIVANSPADLAGLRAGDFLISVNGLNVSKLPHETVVQLIGNSFGSIRMQIAENYYSDSSDEENAALMAQQQLQQTVGMTAAAGGRMTGAGGSQLNCSNGFSGGARAKPRFLHHKTKMHRLRNSPQKKRNGGMTTAASTSAAVSAKPQVPQQQVQPLKPTLALQQQQLQLLRPLIEDLPLNMQQSVSGGGGRTQNKSPATVKTTAAAAPAALIFSAAPSAVASVSAAVCSSSDVANVSAMVRVPTAASGATSLEYRAIVGYLGTIEMPKQISHSSKLQTVRACIRKLRQEKRQPTTVLMTILPDCLRLQAASGSLLASYASERLNYVSSSSESENRFFGLVTSAVHTAQADEDDDDDVEDEDEVEKSAAAAAANAPLADAKAAPASAGNCGHISISNSCHVFVIDTKLCAHAEHAPRAAEFHISCTRDPISSLCLEFPNNSEYVVNLIRSMYTMRILPPASRLQQQQQLPEGQPLAAVAAAHSPQPSNHSEISTTTSNSDSGIGFHNDYAHIAERILVVDFAAAGAAGGAANAPRNRPFAAPAVARPLGIFNNFDAFANAGAAAAVAVADKLTVRAMPDPITPPQVNAASSQSRPNLLANFSLIKSPASSLTATRSCDDMLNLVQERNQRDAEPHGSMDDMALQQHHQHPASTFRHPACILGLPHPPLPLISNHNHNRKQLPLPLPQNGEHYSLLQECRTATRSMQPQRRSLQLSQPPVPSKLSPQVFARPPVVTAAPAAPPETKTTTSTTRHSLGFPAIDAGANDASSSSNANTAVINTNASFSLGFDLDTWRSLQDLHATVTNSALPQQEDFTAAAASSLSYGGVLEATNSEPDLGNRALPANASPFRRAWGQSSFRTPRTDKHAHPNHAHTQHHQSPLVRRTASMTASDNDVYVKSMDGYIDELKHTRSQQQIASTTSSTSACSGSKVAPTHSYPHFSVPTIKVPQIKTEDTSTTASGPTGVAAWGNSFERLLDDPAGLHTFAEFLKKEFSAENIYFWTACERFRHLENETERAPAAMAIYSKHLANGALEPVNVDSQARNLTQEKLQSAERDIFAHAQKQIFNLMKFDSYQRFIRSDLYKSCVDAEERHQALPYGADDLDELLRTNFHQGASGAASKLKKSASNAEDRRRKSLLPWHRKTRSKSRDRVEGDDSNALKAAPTTTSTTTAVPSKLPTLTSSASLKLPSSTPNSLSDLHSSRSSLSSFDAAMPGGGGGGCGLNNNHAASAEMACSLCRVILSDGATTIVQTRSGETVGQLVERLLEKRGLSYQFYDVVANGGSSKSIDLQSPAQLIAGKEVLIEQRVAFKLDLPDPKVISVKSKPKKQLHEVIRPILHKYNYAMEAVQVLMRDTHAQLDLSLPVTVADGKRLQIVLIKSAAAGDYQNGGGGGIAPKFAKPKSVSFPSGINGGGAVAPHMPQSTLDEITNKVFNELLQGKVEAHAAAIAGDSKPPHHLPTKPSDLCSLKSDDCASEASSSIFDRMRRRDSNIPGLRLKFKKKSTSSQHSEETAAAAVVQTPTPTTTTTTAPQLSIVSTTDIKKPIIAKFKAGVKLQVTERVAENQDELLEGLKRAQLARLEDQRGTEINSELPDFLKNKENLNAAASKLRKVRANLSPVQKSVAMLEESPTSTLQQQSAATVADGRPQPAPRLSITNRQRAASSSSSSISPMKIDEEPTTTPTNDTSNSSLEADYATLTSASSCKGPPPLPPKPKVLPIKPSNWGATSTSSFTESRKSSSSSAATTPTIIGAAFALPPQHHSKIPIGDISRKSSAHLPAEPTTTRCAYLEEPSSSFV